MSVAQPDGEWALIWRMIKRVLIKTSTKRRGGTAFGKNCYCDSNLYITNVCFKHAHFLNGSYLNGPNRAQMNGPHQTQINKCAQQGPNEWMDPTGPKEMNGPNRAQMGPTRPKWIPLELLHSLSVGTMDSHYGIFIGTFMFFMCCSWNPMSDKTL